MEYFVDIHCHILPRVDDGAKDEQETLDMLRTAWDDGTRLMVATPHWNRERGYTKSRREIAVAYKRLRDLLSLSIRSSGSIPGRRLRTIQAYRRLLPGENFCFSEIPGICWWNFHR